MLQSWFLSSNSRKSSPEPVPEAELAVPQSVSPAMLNDYLRWARDAEFTDWADGAAGAQRIAMELKNLRAASAQRSISDITSTHEGKEGLLRGLASAMESDPTLAIQLKALLE